MRITIMSAVLTAGLLSGCDNGSKAGDGTIGDRGAGSAAPGNAGGGTFSTNDTDVPAQNLDPTHGSPDAHSTTTGTTSVTTHTASAPGTTQGSSGH